MPEHCVAQPNAAPAHDLSSMQELQLLSRDCLLSLSLASAWQRFVHELTS